MFIFIFRLLNYVFYSIKLFKKEKFKKKSSKNFAKVAETDISVYKRSLRSGGVIFAELECVVVDA